MEQLETAVRICAEIYALNEDTYYAERGLSFAKELGSEDLWKKELAFARLSVEDRLKAAEQDPMIQELNALEG